MQNKKEEILTGTTIMAVKLKNAIIIAADTRTSMGRFIPCRISNKLTKLSDKIYCCRSGSAADTMVIADVARAQLKDYEFRYETTPTIYRAASLCKEIIYSYPQLLAGIIVAGYDETGGHVYNITLGGSMVKMNVALGGSGSPYIYGFSDSNYREDMSIEEGKEFVKNAVSLAIKRDNFSGGCIRMAVINEKGVEEIFIPGNEIY